MTVKERRAKARRLRRRGLVLRDIAEELGVTVGTVHRDLNPKSAARYRAKTREWKRRQRKAKGETK